MNGPCIKCKSTIVTMTESGECVICVAKKPIYTQTQFDSLLNRYLALVDKHVELVDKYCKAIVGTKNVETK